MKKLLISAAALAAMATGAMATDQTITLNATVAPFCSIDGNTSSPQANANLVPITVVNGIPTAVAAQPASMAIVCNKASNVSMTSTNQGVKSSTAPATAAPFSNKINYVATASGFASGTLTTSSAATTGNIPVSGASAATLNVAISAPTVAGGTYLYAASDYTDTLTVSIVPQP
jgi:hypothetical protein